jgi:RNA polymerase sigma-70 factor (ECF subfamily)
MAEGAEDAAAHGLDPDADILQLARAADRDAALRLLMTRHGDAVYQLVRGVVGDDARADDVHQRVFLEAHRDLPQFQSRSTLRWWLFKIARNRAIDAIRQVRRDQARAGSVEESAEVVDPGPLPGELIDDARLQEALAACLAQLPERTRAAMLLKFQQGFTFEEMAAQSGEKPGTLQARVARALPVLRACIERATGGRV